jgi:hypothetical protein
MLYHTHYHCHLRSYIGHRRMGVMFTKRTKRHHLAPLLPVLNPSLSLSHHFSRSIITTHLPLLLISHYYSSPITTKLPLLLAPASYHSISWAFQNHTASRLANASSLWSCGDGGTLHAIKSLFFSLFHSTLHTHLCHCENHRSCGASIRSFQTLVYFRNLCYVRGIERMTMQAS